MITTGGLTVLYLVAGLVAVLVWYRLEVKKRDR